MPEKFNELLLKPDIIELYNSGITPDYGYLMNGRFEKDMIKTLYPLKTLSGNPITWEASDTEYLFPVVSLKPKQAGNGDPSPDNVRPITGYDSVTVTLSKDETQVEQITLTLPETISGGTVDVVTGVGSEEWDIVTLTSDFLATNKWIYGVNGNQNRPVIYGEIPMANYAVGDIYCTHFKRAVTIPIENLEYWSANEYFGNKRITLRNDEWTSLESAKAWLDAQASAGTPVQMVYKLATPTSFQATGNQALTIQPGNHTIYTDGDNISLSRNARRLEV